MKPMTIHERLAAFWSGERPDRIPYTIYQNEWRHTADDPAWQDMYKAGLGVTWHLPSVRARRENVECDERTGVENGRTVSRKTLRTPVGEIWETLIDGWRDKYFLEASSDYRVMAYIARHTHIEPAYDEFIEKSERIGPHGVALVALGRTPLQTMLVDYAGLSGFAYHLFDLEAEVMELYEALLINFRRTVELTAAGPGRFVSVLENFTSDSLGPERYARFLLPVYRELFPVLRQSGKIVGTHYDGRLASCSRLIAEAPIDLIESLTPPPEGDLTLTQARLAWPDRLFWSNINVACYSLPPSRLRDLVLSRVTEAAPDCKRLAFEVSEQYPDNWRDSIPIVLDALEETRG
jgi:hypothetical protein